MIGLPPLLAFYAKEEMYAAVATGDAVALTALAVLVIGNVLLAVAGIAVLVRPFMGALIPTPVAPHEAPPSMLVGPLVLGVVGIGLGIFPKWAGEQFVAPAVSAISGHRAETHLGAPIDFLGTVFWLSVLTWALAIVLYARFDWLRLSLGRLAGRGRWSFDKGFDAAYFGLVRLAALVTRLLHHGRLELYLLVVFVLLAVAVVVPLLVLGGLPWMPAWPELKFYEWGVVAMAAAGAMTVVFAQTRLFAILALGIQGLAIAILYMLFGAPDLSFTQFMVEILSVVILALVMTRLRLDARDKRPLEDWLRDGGVALIAGLSIATLLFAVLEGPLDTRLSDFFNAQSAADCAWAQCRQRHPRRLPRPRYAGRDRGGDDRGDCRSGADPRSAEGGTSRASRTQCPGQAEAAAEGCGMNTLIFRTIAPLLTVVMLVFSVFVLLRGHNEPGGGFIGGLIAASALAIYGMACGPAAARTALKVDPLALAGGGLLLAAGAGMLSLLFGVPFLTGLWSEFTIGDAKVTISTPMVFDIGVYLVVFGAISAMIARPRR